MRILLIGEFSHLHNSLKEGLVALGHEVTIIGNGDVFKNYPVDLSTKAKWCESKLGNIPRQFIYRLTRFDIAQLEFGIRFWFHLRQLKNYDVVQLINESAIQTIPVLERFLLQRIFKKNRKVVLLCCSVDYAVAQHLVRKKERYSIMSPYFENPKAKKEYQYIFSFLTPSHLKTHRFIQDNCVGVIASDIDYVNPNRYNDKFLGLIPNPINTQKISYIEPDFSSKIILFLGINRMTYYTKGILFFEQALAIISEKYSDKVSVVISENLPYNDYINRYNSAHILLDQVYGYDQGYNALEAMAKGKVVFTGADNEFLEYYSLAPDEVAINALPDVDYLVKKLSFLIENPKQIALIGKRARAFIEDKHDCFTVASQYIKTWENR